MKVFHHGKLSPLFASSHSLRPLFSVRVFVGDASPVKFLVELWEDCELCFVNSQVLCQSWVNLARSGYCRMFRFAFGSFKVLVVVEALGLGFEGVEFVWLVLNGEFVNLLLVFCVICFCFHWVTAAGRSY